MTLVYGFKPSAEALAEMPNKPSAPDEIEIYRNLLEALDGILAYDDAASLELTNLAEATNTPIESLEKFFPNPEAVGTALTERYVELAGQEIMLGHTNDGSANWQSVVLEIFGRGRGFYEKYPAAAKLRLSTKQSDGVRHIVLTSTWALAGIIQSELERLFVIPTGVVLLDDLAHSIVISDALWSLSMTKHGRITDEMADEAERAVVGFLAPILGNRLPLR